ncbi:MAG: hypothetical protein ABI321_06900 [Polyangia bacterium]
MKPLAAFALFLSLALLGSLTLLCSPGTARADEHASTPIATRALRIIHDKPFETKTAAIRTLPIKAGGVFVAPVPIVGSVTVVGTAPKHWGAPTTWHVVDLATGAVKAKLLAVGDSSPATRSVVVTIGDAAHKRTALLHLEDGRIVEPKVVLPDGAKVVDVRIALDQRRDVTWLFARRADGRPFQGQWKDTSRADVSLEDNMAFWPTHVSGENGIQAWTETPSASGCTRITVGPDDPLSCRPMASPAAPPFDLIEDCIRTNDDGWLTNDCTSHVLPPTCNIRSRLLSVSAQPARVLSVCEDKGTARFSLWSKDRTQSWQQKTPPSFHGAILERGPRAALAIEALSNADEPVKHWLEIDSDVLYEGPPMVQVALSEHRNDRRRLVQPPDKPNELWLLDLGKGTLELIASDLKCDGRLYSYARSGDRATLECLPKAAVGSLYRDEQRLASWTWMEVVDLARRIRWHTTEVFEAKLGAKIAVGTKRGKPAQLAVVETP